MIHVHYSNFFSGKTTMERYSSRAAAADVDQTSRIVNSGIRDDIQIYKGMGNTFNSSFKVFSVENSK